MTRARRERDLVSLIDQRLQNRGMAVALVHGRICRQAIQIALIVHVVDPDAFGALDNDVERFVIVRAEFFFEVHQVLRFVDFASSRHKTSSI